MVIAQISQNTKAMSEKFLNLDQTMADNVSV